MYQLQDLLYLFVDFASRHDRENQWWWRREKEISFSISSAYTLISDGGMRHDLASPIWTPKNPLKAKLLIWRFSQISNGRLSTCDRLAPFLQNLPTICCSCGQEAEILDHLSTGCSYSLDVWGKIASMMYGAIALHGIVQ